MPIARQASQPEGLHLRLLPGRVGDWRAGLIELPRPHHVSSPRHVERSVRISRTTLSCLLRAKAYGTYPAGATFDHGRRTL